MGRRLRFALALIDVAEAPIGRVHPRQSNERALVFGRQRRASNRARNRQLLRQTVGRCDRRRHQAWEREIGHSLGSSAGWGRGRLPSNLAAASPAGTRLRKDKSLPAWRRPLARAAILTPSPMRSPSLSSTKYQSLNVHERGKLRLAQPLLSPERLLSPAVVLGQAFLDCFAWVRRRLSPASSVRMSVVDETFQHGIADDFVPTVDRKLGRDRCGAAHHGQRFLTASRTGVCTSIGAFRI